MGKLFRLAMSLVVILSPGVALAYVGPGAGVTMLAALWGVVVAIVMAVAAILYWPIRSLLRKRKKAATGSTLEESAPSSDNE